MPSRGAREATEPPAGSWPQDGVENSPLSPSDSYSSAEPARADTDPSPVRRILDSSTVYPPTPEVGNGLLLPQQPP